MNPTRDLERRIADHYAAEAPTRAPDWLLTRALDTIDATAQRRPMIGWPLGKTRPGQRYQGLRRGSVALGGAAAVVLATAVGLGGYDDRPAVGGPSPSSEARSVFGGTWYSSSENDGGTQTMTVRALAEGVVEIVVTNDIASVCSRTPSTMTGTGRLEGSTRLVIPEPVYTCDDGSEAVELSGPPLQEQLRNLTFVRDAQAANLTDNFGGVWLREVGAVPSPSPTTPPPSEPEVIGLLSSFLEARVAGEGAQRYLSIPEEDVPLLYATTSGAPYDRAEFERVLGTEWPYGYTAFTVRLFAGDTVVEQLFFAPPDGRLGLEYQVDGFGTDIAPTTEDGQPVTVPYAYFDGGVTLQAAHPWIMSDYDPVGLLIPDGPGVSPTTDGGERHDWDRLVLMADPLDTDCQRGVGTADAEALADKIRSNPNVEATAPVAVSIAGAEALMMDVDIAQGAWICVSVYLGGDAFDSSVVSPVFDGSWASGGVSGGGVGGVTSGGVTGDRMRLYLFDVPEGSNVRILAIAIVAPEARFERAVEAAAPVLESLEFHAP
jgi:hypothetical protein